MTQRTRVSAPTPERRPGTAAAPARCLSTPAGLHIERRIYTTYITVVNAYFCVLLSAHTPPHKTWNSIPQGVFFALCFKLGGLRVQIGFVFLWLSLSPSPLADLESATL